MIILYDLGMVRVMFLISSFYVLANKWDLQDFGGSITRTWVLSISLSVDLALALLKVVRIN